MKEELIIKASLMAGLITRTLCTKPTTAETEMLSAWTQEHADNKLLVEELTDLGKLNEQLTNLKKFKSVIRLEKINKRLFGKQESF